MLALTAATVVVSDISAAAHAEAAEEGSAAPPPTTISDTQSEDQLLTGAVAPRIGVNRLSALGHGGYDSSRGSPLVGATAELSVTSWLSIRAGVIYVPNDREHNTARPRVGVRAQVLRQASHAVDAAVALSYRQDRFTEEGGLLEGLISVGRVTGRLSAFANLVYAQDPEGDDFEGEVRAAALYRVARPVNLGLQGQLRRDLGSTDLKRLSSPQPSYDFAVGPVVTYTRANLLLSTQTGLSALKQSNLQIGTFVIAAVGAVFN